jgi:ketosteroid isomerase-like protein
MKIRPTSPSCFSLSRDGVGVDTGRAISEENVELAYRAFDAFARHDLDVFVAFHDPDCEIQPLLAAVGGNYHGHDGVREWWGDLFGAFPDLSFRFDEVRELGDRTLGSARITAHGAHGMDSVAPMVEQVSWILAEMRDEKVV